MTYTQYSIGLAGSVVIFIVVLAKTPQRSTLYDLPASLQEELAFTIRHGIQNQYKIVAGIPLTVTRSNAFLQEQKTNIKQQVS